MEKINCTESHVPTLYVLSKCARVHSFYTLVLLSILVAIMRSPAINKQLRFIYWILSPFLDTISWMLGSLTASFASGGASRISSTDAEGDALSLGCVCSHSLRYWTTAVCPKVSASLRGRLPQRSRGSWLTPH